jgi:hypothetical protein
VATKQWNVGDVLTAADLNVWTVPVAVFKPSNTSRNTTTSVADDPDLILPVAASTTYEVRGVIFYDGPATGTGDIKWTFSLPSGATGQYQMIHQNLTAGTAGMWQINWTDGPNLTTTQANTQGTGSPNILAMTFSGLLAVAGTAGNLTFRWAQNTSNGTNTRVYQQSYMVAQRIA